MATNLA